MAQLPARVLVIGWGAVSRCTLPLLLDKVQLDPSQYTVLDFEANPEHIKWLSDRGIDFRELRITPDNYADVLSEHVSAGDIIVDLAWNIDTISMLQWCREHNVRYINASFELWDPYEDQETKHPTERTLYPRHMRLRERLAEWGDNSGPTAILDHGANPGLVSHFTKRALVDIANAVLAKGDPDAAAIKSALQAKEWNKLAQALEVKVIHISERDTQISNEPKTVNEFVNTWSVEGFYEEGIAPAEMGWGTHERTMPADGFGYETGPRNQICLAQPGCQTQVRSWVPSGEIVGMVIRHGEAFSISEYLTVEEDGEAVYRPTVHYAYCPADVAIVSMHELAMRNFDLQPRHRILNDDIISGNDELGVLLLGHKLNGWWVGSLLDIEETRSLVPGQNATTLQVAAAVLGGVLWLIENPAEGVLLPDALPHEQILGWAEPYLGPMVSTQSDWTPLQNWSNLFANFGHPKPADEDVWQFETFRIRR